MKKLTILIGAALLLLPVICRSQQKINLAGVYEANTKLDIGTKQLYAVLDFNTSNVPDFTVLFPEKTAKFALLPEDFMKKVTQNFQGRKAAGFVKYRSKFLFNLTEQLCLTNPRLENGVITVDWEDELQRKGTCTLMVHADKSIQFTNLGAFEGTTRPDGLVITCVEDRSLKEMLKVEPEKIDSKTFDVKNPFKGEWFTELNGMKMTVRLDLYEKTVDQDGMKFSGFIHADGTTYVDEFVEKFKINGNTATLTITTYGVGTDVAVTQDVIVKYSAIDGSLTLITQKLYGQTQMGKYKALPETIVLSKEASGPFAGYWLDKTKTAALKLNLYKPFSTPDDPGAKISGYINITIGMKVDMCTVSSYKIDENKAVIEYVGGRDGNTYRSTLIYNPVNRQITLKGKELIQKGDFDMEDSYVNADMVFFPSRER